ncbi:SURF1 family protein [Maricaulaceae bacterium EIL42A08]|nr:SURF1 family protein [Maricaulaceae bacterium EIL42A08]
MTFKPFPVLTLLTLPALAFLVWLGSWQLDRRAWKAELIGQFEATAALPAASLGEILCEGDDGLGRAVTPDALSAEQELSFYGLGPEGAPGWRIFSAVAAPACLAERHILIEVRFEPLMAARANVDGRAAVVSETQAWRLERPREAGPFTPPNTFETAEYYSFAPDMALALGLQDGSLSPDWWVARDSGEPPAHLTQTPPERHVGYAVTWFLMAIALIAIYLIFHIRAGRLRFGTRDV